MKQTKLKTMSAKELAIELYRLHEHFGDINVALSADPEGNGFATLDPEHSLQYDSDTGLIILFPYAQAAELEEIA